MWRRLFIVAGLAITASAAQSQDYPTKPIRLIVPYAGGGAGDIIARPIAEKLREELGQPIVIENKAGAQSVIGSEFVQRADADGYTLLMNFSTFGATQFFVKGVPYDTLKDFTPIIKAAMAPQCAVVSLPLPVKNITELVEYAKKQPNGISYGSTGNGNPPHIAGEMMKARTGANFVQVIYRGGGPLMNDLLGGQIPMAFLTLATALPHTSTGKLRMIGMLESRRTTIAPDIPTVAETGLPGFSIPETWVGFLGPANMPRPIVDKLNAAFNKVLKSPDLKQLLETAGYELVGGTPEELAAQMKADVESFRKVVETAGITPQ